MEITPPEDREICRSIDFAPRGPRDCPRAKPEGNLSVLGGRNFQYIPPLVSVILPSANARFRNVSFYFDEASTLMEPKLKVNRLQIISSG